MNHKLILTDKVHSRMSPFPNTLLPAIIGDIGGTNIRFQLIDSTGKAHQFKNAPTAEFENLQTAIDKIVLENTELAPQTAIIAAAGPITRHGLNLTNCHWDIKAKEVLQTSSLQDLILLNDFEAQALSLPYLQADDLCSLGHGGPFENQAKTKAVVGPGTGLGVGLLVRNANQWVPVAGEGGHVDLGPRSERERTIWDHLVTAEGRVSAEQVLSGEGLCNLYQACCRADGVDISLNLPCDISLAALENSNNQAIEALTIFCNCLGRIAGDLALTTMAKGGVYIAGGIAKKIIPFLQSSNIRNEFEDKAPHEDLLREIPLYIVKYEIPALLGLAAFARNPDEFLMDIDYRHWSK